MTLQQYCLRWKYHHSNLQTMFSQLLDRGCFCDVTLACEGQTIKAHRVVLCACSTFFDSILTNRYTDKDPIIIMKDCKFEDIRCLIEFMYRGEINVEHVCIEISIVEQTSNSNKIISSLIFWIVIGAIGVAVANGWRIAHQRTGRGILEWRQWWWQTTQTKYEPRFTCSESLVRIQRNGHHRPQTT